LALCACDDSKTAETTGEDATAKEASPPPPPPADVDVPLPTMIEGQQHEVDSAKSSIEFTGAKVTKSHDGGFEKFDGVIVVKDDAVVGTRFSIDLTSTTADAVKLTKHLLGKDFFHTEKYATAVFVSSEIVPAAEPGAVTHDVKGVLDLHGRQRPLSFPASVTVGEAGTTVSATFDINRQNWGIAYPGSPDNLIKDDVQIRLNLSFADQPSGEAPAEDDAAEGGEEAEAAEGGEAEAAE